MHDVYPMICRVYHRTTACVFVSGVCYSKLYIQRDANPQIWKGRCHTHVLASESVEAVVNHDILFGCPTSLLLDISKCFFLLDFSLILYFISNLSQNTTTSAPGTRQEHIIQTYTSLAIATLKLRFKLSGDHYFVDEICLIIKTSVVTTNQISRVLCT